MLLERQVLIVSWGMGAEFNHCRLDPWFGFAFVWSMRFEQRESHEWKGRTTDNVGSAEQERPLDHGCQWANRDIQIEQRPLLMRRT